ncbi:salutaridine reductase-like, partial [Phalaenopsis equestris]|uniref:salutaridine reductase-like n=1 Tax=Phalaenopsis equestris TaxID=78828 RepID=UPI0009E52DA8
DEQNAGLCAVVTGANKGIGLAIVRQLADCGVAVVLTARDEARGTAAVRSLQSAGLTNVLYHQLDIRDPLSAATLARFLQDRFGKLDILVGTKPPLRIKPN